MEPSACSPLPDTISRVTPMGHLTNIPQDTLVLYSQQYRDEKGRSRGKSGLSDILPADTRSPCWSGSRGGAYGKWWGMGTQLSWTQANSQPVLEAPDELVHSRAQPHGLKSNTYSTKSGDQEVGRARTNPRQGNF